MARVIFNGQAGDEWQNDTGKVQYQLLVSWHNSCGQCIQFDHAIGPYWGIPLHRGCRCRQKAIAPGARAAPFVDFMSKIDGLDVKQQGVVVGRSNLLLIQKGIVTWEDVVTPTRIRDLREVVARQKLTVPVLTRAGVRKDIAERAFATVHTPAHELAERTRAELVAKLRGAGLTDAQIQQAAGERLARRVTIGSGPSGGMGFAAKPTTPVPPRPRPAGTPLSAALEVQTTVPQKKTVETTLRAIDAVHGTAPLPRIPVRPLPKGDPREGVFKARQSTGAPVAIELSETSRVPHLGCAHEVGHLLDIAAIPHVGTPTKTTRDWAADTHLSDFHAAAQASASVKALQAAAVGGTAAVDPRRAQYLLRPQELWARAYSQYIAVRSGAPDLLKELDALRTDPNLVHYPIHWSDDDFRPIGRAIDALFRKLGWRQ